MTRKEIKGIDPFEVVQDVCLQIVAKPSKWRDVLIGAGTHELEPREVAELKELESFLMEATPVNKYELWDVLEDMYKTSVEEPTNQYLKAASYKLRKAYLSEWAV